MITPPTYDEWCYYHIEKANDRIKFLKEVQNSAGEYQGFANEIMNQRCIIVRMLTNLEEHRKKRDAPKPPKRRWYQFWK